jgi:hypothetical protein
MTKTYSLSEAIQMLEKNHELEFTQHTDVDGIVFLKLNDRGWLVSRNDHGEGMIIGIDGKWELVKKPVTFMEAVKALDVGKTIYCQYINSYTNKGDLLITHTYTPKANGGLWDEKNYPPTIWMILNADWYIEEDEDV